MEIHTRIHSSIQKSKVPYLFDLSFSSSSLPLPLLLLLHFSSLPLYGFLYLETKFGLKSNFELRPCLAFAFLSYFSHFLQLSPSIHSNFHFIFSLIASNPITSSIYISFFSNSILAYKLMVLCLSCPQVVND